MIYGKYNFKCYQPDGNRIDVWNGPLEARFHYDDVISVVFVLGTNMTEDSDQFAEAYSLAKEMVRINFGVEV